MFAHKGNDDVYFLLITASLEEQINAISSNNSVLPIAKAFRLCELTKAGINTSHKSAFHLNDFEVSGYA